ncbi:MAG TPA: DUF4395 domain-containing protein [Micromonosporaceae bacterium]|nr:DUF4395 domain-containing protein [Micromonosporaceae bacterium]
MITLIDPRGPRVSAWLTSAVLLVILLTGSGALALAQALVFAIGALSLRYAPYSLFYRWFVAPRLRPPAELEHAAPVRFSQAVGFAFTAVAAIGYLTGASIVGAVFAGFALVAAFLNAAFGLCLACKVYPFISLYIIRRKAEGVSS